MLHHPFAALLVAWLGLLSALEAIGAITLKLDAGAIVVGLVPTAVVVLNYYLAKRQRIAIAAEAAAKVAEVHGLVNSTADDMKAELSRRDGRIEEQDRRIAQLEAQLASSLGSD